MGFAFSQLETVQFLKYLQFLYLFTVIANFDKGIRTGFFQKLNFANLSIKYHFQKLPKEKKKSS